MKPIIICLGLVCLLSGRLQAQVQTLSLSDAIQIGLDRNYDIRIEKGNVEVATNNNTWGEAGRLPQVDISVGYNTTYTDNVKTAFPTATQGQTLNSAFIPGVNVNWVLFDGFRIYATKRRLEQLQAESSGNASIVIANTLQSIILGYYLVVLEEERLEEFKKQLNLSSDRYELTKTKYDLGSSVTTDLLLEEGNYLTDSVNVINQELVVRNALRNLNVLLAEDDLDQPYHFVDSLSVEEEVYDLYSLQQKMLAENVDLRRQYISQSVLTSNKDIAKADRYPSLSFNAGITDNRSRLNLSRATFFTGEGFASGPSDPLRSVTDNYFANFTLSWTLFNGGRINRAIKNAVLQEDIGNLRVEQLKNRLDRDLSEAYDRYKVRLKLYRVNERREASAALNLSVTEEKFKGGTINSFDFRVVQNNYLSASIVRLQSLFNVIDSKIELMRLTGGLVQAYN